MGSIDPGMAIIGLAVILFLPPIIHEIWKKSRKTKTK